MYIYRRASPELYTHVEQNAYALLCYGASETDTEIWLETVYLNKAVNITVHVGSCKFVAVVLANLQSEHSVVCWVETVNRLGRVGVDEV